MSALLLLSALMAIVYLMAWMIQNDGATRIEDQKGLLRMIRPKSSTAVVEDSLKPSKPRGRPGPVFPARTLRPMRPARLEANIEPAPAEAAEEQEEEIIHPLWRDRRGKRRR